MDLFRTGVRSGGLLDKQAVEVRCIVAAGRGSRAKAAARSTRAGHLLPDQRPQRPVIATQSMGIGFRKPLACICKYSGQFAVLRDKEGSWFATALRAERRVATRA